MTTSKRRVFLVEDEHIIAMHTEAMLSELGYEVSMTAATLEGGLRAASSDGFEIAVLDINLRGANSYPIAEVLEERGIPYVFVSGYAATGIEQRFSKVPSLQKPFTADALEEILSRTLAAESG